MAVVDGAAVAGEGEVVEDLEGGVKCQAVVSDGSCTAAETFLGYDINTRNTTTDYQSGQVFHIDATVAQHLPLGKGLIGIGANGFYLQQTTGDSGSGARLGGFEETTAGVGPVLSYAAQFGKTGFAAELKWLPQIGTQNTLAGNYIWLRNWACSFEREHQQSDTRYGNETEDQGKTMETQSMAL